MKNFFKKKSGDKKVIIGILLILLISLATLLKATTFHQSETPQFTILAVMCSPPTIPCRDPVGQACKVITRRVVCRCNWWRFCIKI